MIHIGKTLHCMLGILILGACQCSEGNDGSLDTDSDGFYGEVSGDTTGVGTGDDSSDSKSSDTESGDSQTAPLEIDLPEMFFNKWRLTYLMYMEEELPIDPENVNPTLVITKDKNGNIATDASACYTHQDDYCELASDAEITCAGYVRHSIIWGSDFPCSEDEMTVEGRFFISMENYITTIELTEQTLTLSSDDGAYELRFEL